MGDLSLGHGQTPGPDGAMISPASTRVEAPGEAVEQAARAQQRRIQQIQELVRLSHTLRADLGLREILRQLASAVSTTTGFGIAAFNLVREGSERLEVAAVAGLAAAQYQPLVDTPPRLDAIARGMRQEFRLGRAYYIPHEQAHVLDGIEFVSAVPAPPEGTPWPRGIWHPDDTLLIPLVTQRDERLLGILSLDMPEDSRVPTLDTIEVVELFANLAAVAIEMASLFDERERNRQALEDGLARLRDHMEQVGRGNLAEPVNLSETALSPIGDALNTMVGRLRGVVADVRQAGAVVSDSAAETQAATRDLADKAQRQARQILEVSEAVAGMAGGVRRISETGATADEVARRASEIAHLGRESAEQAAIGMAGVREMTLRSARNIKRLGETAQQIGEVVRLVGDFAEQTNVLALNAAIEAVRAGEHGSGFKIIAQQIRTLAENSTEATARITQRIKSVQTETSAVAIAIEECTRQVVIQSDLAAQAGAALGAVDMVSQQIAGRVEEIRATAEEQTLVSLRVARAMDEIAGVTAGTRDGMEWMRGAMERLAELARSLQREIAVFRLQPGAAPGALAAAQTARDAASADAAFAGARAVRATPPPEALPGKE